MAEETNEGFDFNQEEFEKKVLEVIEPILIKQPYDESKVQHLQNLICERVMKMLIDLNLNCKFLSRMPFNPVNCTLIQKRGTGYVTATANYWDSGQDWAIKVLWPKEMKNQPQTKMMRCFVTIHAISF